MSDRLSGPTARPWFLRFALLIGSVVLGCYAFGAWVIVRPSGIPKTFGWDAAMRDHRWIVSGVDPSGPAAGKLHNGDRLLAFNEDRRAEQIGPELFMYFLPPGSAYTVHVWRNPRESDTTLALKLAQPAHVRVYAFATLGVYSGVNLAFAGIIYGVPATRLPLGPAWFCSVYRGFSTKLVFNSGPVRRVRAWARPLSLS